MAHDLAYWVSAFHGKKVLLIGDLILDRYLYGDAERISPEAPVPVLRTVETQEAVGGSANVAACLAALDCRVTCCGVVGDDAHGKTLRGLLEELRVDAGGVISLNDRPTTTKTRLVGLAQHRHRQQLLRVDHENADPLPPSAAGQLAECVLRLASEADVICIEDYDKGVVCESLVQAIVDEAKRLDCQVLADPARLSDYQRYHGAGILTPNRAELSIATGRTLDSVEEVADAARFVLEKYALSAVVATVDRDGAVVVEQERSWQHIPTIPRSVYDNTGAGDAVLAMLAAAVAGGTDLVNAARLANIAGGLEVERFGCVPIKTEEVLAELRLEDRVRNGKFRSVDELVAELNLRRDRGETVAFTNGCFDILHAGHVDYLTRCRQQASLLVVGLNTDASVRLLDKGPDRPINKLADRASVVGALECVDYVCSFDEPDPETLIRKIRPDILIKGEDWATKGVVGREFVESVGGRVVLLPLVEGHSTSAIVERIQSGA
ncbi:MAG: bifunctional heptose 7-phosphate kinase/heptose 1-phosphate adenyltransferase [Phycisphaerales bacterium]|nr:MAG: bifunctional heptose 7-phosphate kinase/heptose 1-phosphate adenyltransferase [Phycisphaerales bacterium]